MRRRSYRRLPSSVKACGPDKNERIPDFFFPRARTSEEHFFILFFININIYSLLFIHFIFIFFPQCKKRVAIVQLNKIIIQHTKKENNTQCNPPSQQWVTQTVLPHPKIPLGVRNISKIFPLGDDVEKEKIVDGTFVFFFFGPLLLLLSNLPT